MTPFGGFVRLSPLILGAAALELPSCDVVTFKYLGESGRTCLHLDAERPSFAEDGAGNRTCADTPSWTDGTNGCARYASNPHWCDEYRALGAWRHCCACGGGATGRFAPGDLVEVRVDNPRAASAWTKAVVVQLRPERGVACLVALGERAPPKGGRAQLVAVTDADEPTALRARREPQRLAARA